MDITLMETILIKGYTALLKHAIVAFNQGMDERKKTALTQIFISFVCFIWLFTMPLNIIRWFQTLSIIPMQQQHIQRKYIYSI